MKYIFSIALIWCLVVSGFAQAPPKKQSESKPAEKKIDTVKVDYRPTGLRLGTDLIGLVRSQVDANYQAWEVNADVDFYRYYFAVDYGYWARKETLKNGNFENAGNYFRVGTDVNFLLKDPDRNMFFMGYRYGQSNFDHSADYLITKYLVQETQSYTDHGVRAHWMELTAGLRVKIWKMIWLGYTARFKFAPRASGYSELQPYDIPGYGIFERKIYWGFNYQLFIRIPFRKEKQVKSVLSK